MLIYTSVNGVGRGADTMLIESVIQCCKATIITNICEVLCRVNRMNAAWMGNCHVVSDNVR